MTNKFFKDLERLINKIFDSRKVFDAKEEKRKKNLFCLIKYFWEKTTFQQTAQKKT